MKIKRQYSFSSLSLQISHSSLILEFFETQSCDPKPIINYSNINSSDFENDDNNSEENDDDEDDDDDDDEDDENKEDSDYNNNKENYLSNDDDDDDDLMMRNIRLNSYQQQQQQQQHHQQQQQHNNNNGDDEAGLWWDEDNALNELTFETTMSSSFNNYSSNLIDNSTTHDLDCLENILSNYRFNDSSD